MMTRYKQWLWVLSLAIASIATAHTLSWGVYGLSGAWALTVVYAIALAEWFINTLWAKMTATNKTGWIVTITFVNAFASMLVPALHEMIKVYNPDGFSFRVAGIISYGLGGAFGAYLACRVSKK